MNAIVQVNVSQTIAPTPPGLQKTGAFLSQGGTTTSPGTRTLITQLADLTAILKPAAAITSLTFNANIVTAVCTNPHGLPVGDVVNLTIAGSVGTVTPNGYNGTFACTVTDTTHFTYHLPGNSPGGTPTGTWVSGSVNSLTGMGTTFFAQGSQQAVYVLELGYGNVSEGVNFLTAWIAANPNVFYSYLVPRHWDSDPAYLALLASFEATNSKTYFFTTTTLQNYTNYTALMKCCVALIEAPSYSVWAANALTGLSFAAGWGANVLTAITWAATGGGQVTATTTTAHGVQPGNTFSISGCTPTGYNGTFVALPGTTGSTLIYALVTNPGVETVLGTLVADPGGTVTATTTTAHGVSPGQYFTIQGSTASVVANGYNGTFLALPGTTGSTLLYALATNPGTESVLGTLAASLYASTGVNPAVEFSLAALFHVTLNYAPSTTNRVTPTAFSFLFGVTPFPTAGNVALISTIQAAFTNIVGTGAEGGISTAMVDRGVTRDGRDFTYWYSVDWVQINSQLNIANAIINGSNNPLNPLYYNQDGINRLQQVAASTLSSGLTFGLVLGAVVQKQLDGAAFQAALNNGDFDGLTVINAVPFVPYSQANPNDYAVGQYSGLSCVYVPTRGFTHVVFNINVTDFVAA